MIQEFVNAFIGNKGKLEEALKQKHPDSYKELVTLVVTYIGAPLDPEQIQEIDDGDYQGTLFYIIGEGGSQPCRYWSTAVDYGSCTHCDTFQRIQDYDSGPPTERQVKDYMTLALHLVQELEETIE